MRKAATVPSQLALLLLLSSACPARAQKPGPGPDAAAWPEGLETRLLQGLRDQGPEYEPRTEHRFDDGGPRFVNRLILEDSPYLVQHAHNPVDWYPWGEEAFARAAQEDKPIFLSIGYSTCHWCHVMERESFDDVEIARQLNRSFVCIKVDRERRPDVDDIYMTAVQLVSGRGGWPMSSFLTPDGKPFFGATYFPPQQFKQLLARVEEVWQSRRAALEQDAERLAAAVAEVTAARGAAAEVGPAAVAAAVEQLLGRHDAERGGFGSAPKFPHEPDLLLLLQYSARPDSARSSEALQAAETTLLAMARGGIYDQIGGGFHRYSTDADWLVPHFEKMLYNQAHLGRAYVAAAELTGKASYRRVARQTFDYVLREMTAPQGGFYSATDADSEGREGEFFVWTPAQLAAALEAGELELALEAFGVSQEGNFEGRSILHLPRSLEEVAESRGLALAALLEQLDELSEKLRSVRSTRIPPLRDDKLITAWNGMMVTAFAEAARLLGDRRYREAAERAADFLWKHNRRPDEASLGLWRVHLNGSSSIAGLLEDYAYLCEAMIALYDLTAEPVWLERARELADAMLERFWDPASGGFFMGEASGTGPELIARPKSPTDGAIPSGNSVAARALGRLEARSGDRRYRDRAAATLAAYAATIDRRPTAFSYMLLGADELVHGEVGPREYGAAGRIRILGRTGAERPPHLSVELDIAPGWHVNANPTLQEELIPTKLDLAGSDGSWRLERVAYPSAEEVRLGFQDQPLAVYQGRVTLIAELERTPARPSAPPILHARLRLQACDDRACLQPEEVILEVPAP